MRKFLVAGVVVALAACGQSAVGPDGKTIDRESYQVGNVARVRMFTDPLTGCEYVLMVDGGMYPRMELFNGGYIHRGCVNKTATVGI
jgi:hypothetical protein